MIVSSSGILLYLLYYHRVVDTFGKSGNSSFLSHFNDRTTAAREFAYNDLW